MKPLTLPPEAREAAVASIRRFADEELEVELGAGWLLDVVLAETGPFATNAGVRERVEAHAQDLDVELHRPELAHWRRR